MVAAVSGINNNPDLRSAAEVYAATFAGRLDAYSVWNGESWQAIRRPLTADVVLEAFGTGIPISGYVLTPEARTHIACLDIDLEDGLSLGKRFGRHLDKLGGLGYIEHSARGCHVWIAIDRQLPAIVVRRALKALIEESGLPDDRKIELRPTSDRLNGPESLGSCIRMPTMPHPRLRKRFRLTSTQGEVLPGKLIEMMLEIDSCPASVIVSASERAPAPALTSAPNDLRYPHGNPSGNESVSEILRNLWGVQNARPGITVKCPAHDDMRPSLSIAKDDQRVWCMSHSCLLSGEGGDQGLGAYQLTQLAPKR